jgi:hypothetical protein
MDGAPREEAEGVWTVSRPHRMMGIELGARMTIVRLPDGGLWLHSPVALEPALQRAVEALGEVRHLVCPNLYHHVYAGPWADAYPDALVHAPRGLRRKRRDLRIDAHLGETPHPAWGDAFVPLRIEGCRLQETVFVHPASRSVVSADLAENFATSSHWPTRLYLKAAGLEHRVGFSRMLRFLFRDHRAARRSLDRLLEHDFDRLVLSHGAVVTDDPAGALRQTYAFLRA